MGDTLGGTLRGDNAALEFEVVQAAIKFTELGGYYDDLSENVSAQGDLMDAVEKLNMARKQVETQVGSGSFTMLNTKE